MFIKYIVIFYLLILGIRVQENYLYIVFFICTTVVNNFGKIENWAICFFINIYLHFIVISSGEDAQVTNSIKLSSQREIRYFCLELC